MILRRLDTRFHRAFFVQIFKQGYERAGLDQRGPGEKHDVINRGSEHREGKENPEPGGSSAVQIRMVPATLAGGEESQVSSFPCLRDVDFLLSQPRSISCSSTRGPYHQTTSAVSSASWRRSWINILTTTPRGTIHEDNL